MFPLDMSSKKQPQEPKLSVVTPHHGWRKIMLFNRFQVVFDAPFWVSKFWFEMEQSRTPDDQFAVALHTETLVRHMKETLQYLGTLGDVTSPTKNSILPLSNQCPVEVANLMSMSTQGDQSEVCFHNVSMQAIVQISKGQPVHPERGAYPTDAIALLRSSKDLHKIWLTKLYENLVESQDTQR